MLTSIYSLPRIRSTRDTALALAVSGAALAALGCPALATLLLVSTLAPLPAWLSARSEFSRIIATL